MATKKTKKVAASEAAKETPVKPTKKAGRAKMTPEEKAAKKKARLEALKNRPEGQRTNSKQIDVIELENGNKVMSFGMPVRKVGTLVTTVSVNGNGEVTSTSTVVVAGVSPKVKKGHGTLVPKTPGVKKGSEVDDNYNEEEVEEEENDDEDEE